MRRSKDPTCARMRDRELGPSVGTPYRRGGPIAVEGVNRAQTKGVIFFSLPFWNTARKTTKKARISYACQTPKILGKERKNAQNRKEFLEKEKGKEIQKRQGKED